MNADPLREITEEDIRVQRLGAVLDSRAEDPRGCEATASGVLTANGSWRFQSCSKNLK